ncbi:STAS domain-containing protein [Actinomadura latina]|uniref:Anti-sigma factor antagonist n=1 Tax=Actinomadura latina TaxID=163603 RepID=A0A846YZ92_9ACTN|nr:STAS domain-containing protein [Actinomadura latina]NKZ04122.1 STAS domain-containing protein [Actinomadura latina]
MTEETRPARRAVRRVPEVRCRAGGSTMPAAPDVSAAAAARAAGGLRIEVAGVRGDTAVVEVAGEIDLRTAGALRDRLVELHGRPAGAGPRRLVADFTAVPFCDAAGLGALVAAHNQIAADGGEIVLAGVRPAQLRLLRITGLHRLFAVHAAVDDVWAAPGPPAASR